MAQYLYSYLVVFILSSLSLSCGKEDFIIDPESNYEWPEKVRDYWPTEGWRTSSPLQHGIDIEKLNLAEEFASNDPLSRALLVIKDGYLVFENYYDEGGIDKSTNLWSVTKSFSSALVGLIIDDGYVQSPDQLMAELLPQYPQFNQITLHHALTQTTGLSWVEHGLMWDQWIMSDDWVASALARGQVNDPGSEFFYSSANSHFLTSLVFYSTGISPGTLAKDRIFTPLGIEFDTISHDITYTDWDQYIPPLHQTWRKDPKGIECASFSLYLTTRDMAKFGYLFLNKGNWDGQQILSEDWVELSTRDHETNIYERYSYGYQWWITFVGEHPAFLASGFGGQIIGIVPSLDLVVVLKYEAENPKHPESGTDHDDMYLFELVVNSVN